MEEIVIEKINYKPFVLSLSTLFLLITAGAITLYGFGEDKVVFWLPGILASIVLLLAFITAVVNTMKIRRLLTITREGIIDHSSLSGATYLSFDDIKDFSIVTIYNREAIAVIPKNIDALMPKLHIGKRRVMKKNIHANLAPITISTHLAKDMEPEDILSLLKKRLNDYSSLYE